MKSFTVGLSGVESAVTIVERYSCVLSTFMNNAFFPHDEKLVMKMNHFIELSSHCWLMQFSAYHPSHKDELIPALVTVVVNANAAKTEYEFTPFYIMSTPEAGCYEIKVFETETIFDHLVHKVTPAFDCCIDNRSSPLSARIVFKFFIFYKNDPRGQIVTSAEMPFHVDYLIQDEDQLHWSPIRQEFLANI